MGGLVTRPSSAPRVLDLVESSRTVADVARDLHPPADRPLSSGAGRTAVPSPWLTSAEKAELAEARRRIAELQTESAIARRAVDKIRGGRRSTRRYAAIKVVAPAGLPVRQCRSPAWSSTCAWLPLAAHDCDHAVVELLWSCMQSCCSTSMMEDPVRI